MIRIEENTHPSHVFDQLKVNRNELNKISPEVVTSIANEMAEAIAKSIQAGNCRFGKAGLCAIETMEGNLNTLFKMRKNIEFEDAVGIDTDLYGLMSSAGGVIIGGVASIIGTAMYAMVTNQKDITLMSFGYAFLGINAAFHAFIQYRRHLRGYPRLIHQSWKVGQLKDAIYAETIERLEKYWGVRLTGKDLEEKRIALQHLLGDVNQTDYYLAFPEKLQAETRFWSAEVSATLEAAKNSGKFREEELELLKDSEQIIKAMAAEFHRKPRWGTRKRTWTKWIAQLQEFKTQHFKLVENLNVASRLDWTETQRAEQNERLDLTTAPFDTGRLAQSKMQFLKGADPESESFVEWLSDVLVSPLDKNLQKLYLDAAEKGERLSVQVIHEMIVPYENTAQQKRGLAKVTLQFSLGEQPPVKVEVLYHHRLQSLEQLKARGMREPALERGLRKLFQGGDLRLLSQMVAPEELRHTMDFENLEFPELVGDGVQIPLMQKVSEIFKGSKRPIDDIWTRVKDELMNLQSYQTNVELKLSETKEKLDEHRERTPSRFTVLAAAKEAKRLWEQRLSTLEERVKVLGDLNGVIQDQIKIRLKLADELSPYLHEDLDAPKVAEIKSRVSSLLDYSFLPLRHEVQEKVSALKDASLQFAGTQLEEIGEATAPIESADTSPDAARTQAHAACGDALKRNLDSLDGPADTLSGGSSITQ